MGAAWYPQNRVDQPQSAYLFRDSELHCEEVPLRRVATEVGTPCYVYSASAIRGNYRRFASAFDAIGPTICYAVKANSNLSVLRLLKEEGSGFDVVSAGEIHRLRQIGADLSKVLFSGVGKTRAELELAMEFGLLVNIESVQELDALSLLASRRGARVRVSLRVNPDVQVDTHPYISTGLRQHKFGIDIAFVDRIIETIRKNARLELVAVGCHIGSQILDVQPFLAAFLKIRELAEEFRSKGLAVSHLDLGGGVGIPYRGEPRPDLARYASFLEQHRGDYSVVFEPGRYIVGDAGALLTQVVYRKVNNQKEFVVVDGAMNDLMRPSLYQAHHEILPLRQASPSLRADLVGPVCETGDFFARDREVPDLQPGDYLALMNAGAYGFALSSNYNSRPRSAEVLVDGARFEVVRRRESFEDLVRGEA